MTDFPFGINPGLPLPGNLARASVEIEGVGDMSFADPQESVGGLVAQVLVMNTGESRIGGLDFFTVTAWDAEACHLTVKLKEAEVRAA
jgi:hypothetical protein